MNKLNQANALPIKPIQVIESSEEEIDLDYIITKKPKTSIVREFLKINIETIKNIDDEIFENPK